MHFASTDQLAFRRAGKQDVDLIVGLVNSAYRGDSSRRGWTTEADLLGGQRTDREEVVSLIEAADSFVMIGSRGSEAVGCVHLQKAEQSAYFGMFAIKPALQGMGIGKQFMQAAERVVQQEWDSSKMLMTVITLRAELIAFYQRRGYRRTGELKPFPVSERFGIPRVAGLQLEVLEKELRPGGEPSLPASA
ncbi:MAG TPA: GNAT family N-acetyltransferase [Gammaproteobacteria bacterium]|nr:GNAT family N-acetyltransferase [Gammaproteobacteria bacterium]